MTAQTGFILGKFCITVCTTRHCCQTVLACLERLQWSKMQDSVLLMLAAPLGMQICNAGQHTAAATHSHGPHLQHGPFLLACLLADLGDGVPIGLHCKVEDGVNGLLICSFCFSCTTCVPNHTCVSCHTGASRTALQCKPCMLTQYLEP